MKLESIIEEIKNETGLKPLVSVDKELKRAYKITIKSKHINESVTLNKHDFNDLVRGNFISVIWRI